MKRVLICVMGIAFAGWWMYLKRRQLAGIFSVLAYTTAFTLLLSPVSTKLEKRGMRSSNAAMCSVIGLFLIVIVLIAAFIPYLVTRTEQLIKRITPAAPGIMDAFLSWNSSAVRTASLSEAGGLFGGVLGFVTGKLFRGGMTAAKQIGRIAFSLVLTYYALCDRKRIGYHLLLVVPARWRHPVLSALLACRNAMLSYASGLLKTSVFVTAATLLGLLLLGVQDALLLAMMMGILEVLPYVGPVLASIPILLSAMLQGAETTVFTLIMLILVQQVEGNFVSPYFMASSTSVHPLAAICVVFIAGSLFGLWGILLAVPMLVLLQSIVCSIGQTQRAMRESMLGDQ